MLAVPFHLLRAVLSSTTTASALSVSRFSVSSELYGCTTTSLVSAWLGNTLRAAGLSRQRQTTGIWGECSIGIVLAGSRVCTRNCDHPLLLPSSVCPSSSKVCIFTARLMLAQWHLLCV